MADMKERRRANFMVARDYAYADAAERVRFQAGFAEKMLNAMMLANGGAIIGLFTFVGNLIGKAGSPIILSIAPLWIAFASFVLGLSLTLGAHFFAFLSQQKFYEQSMHEVQRLERALALDEPQFERSAEIASNKRGHRYYSIGLAIAVIAVLLFIIGSGAALFDLLPR